MRREIAGGDGVTVAVDVVVVFGGILGCLYEQCDDPALFHPEYSFGQLSCDVFVVRWAAGLQSSGVGLPHLTLKCRMAGWSSRCFA